MILNQVTATPLSSELAKRLRLKPTKKPKLQALKSANHTTLSVVPEVFWF